MVRLVVSPDLQSSLVVLGSHVVVLVITWVFRFSSHPAASPFGSSPTPRGPVRLHRTTNKFGTMPAKGTKTWPHSSCLQTCMITLSWMVVESLQRLVHGVTRQVPQLSRHTLEMRPGQGKYVLYFYTDNQGFRSPKKHC